MIKFVISMDKKRRINMVRSTGYKTVTLHPVDKKYSNKRIEDSCDYYEKFDVDEQDLPFLNDAQIVEFAVIDKKAFILTRNKRGETAEYVSELTDFALFIDMTDLIRYILLYGNLRKALPNEYNDTFNEYNRYIEF